MNEDIEKDTNIGQIYNYSGYVFENNRASVIMVVCDPTNRVMDIRLSGDIITELMHKDATDTSALLSSLGYIITDVFANVEM